MEEIKDGKVKAGGGTAVIFSTAYLPLVGGAETALKGITDNIDNFHFILLTSRFRKSLPSTEKIGNTVIYRLGFGNSLDKYFLPLFSFFKFISVKNNLQKPVLFWGMMASYGSIGAMLSKIFFPRIPFVLTIQEGDREWEKNKFWWRRILSKADFVTTISSFLLVEVRKAGYAGKAEIIHNGVDLEKYGTPGKSKSGKTIVSISRRVYKNGLDVLERAFDIVKKKFPEAELKIISDAKHEDVPRYLSEADIFVRPSRSEGLGTAFLEAMAAGLPIIATPVGGIPDFLKDRETGLFTKVDDPEDLAEKIEMLFNDEKLREKLIINGRKLVEEKYQWPKIVRDMERVFDSLL